MIPTPRGWRRIDVGDDVLLVPLDVERAGVVRYRERLPAVLPVRELVAGQLADNPQFEVETIGEPDELVTFEGEHAALVTVTGRLDGEPVQRLLGYVLTDDFHARVSALVLAADERERFTMTTRQLLERVMLRLGTRRRRVRCEAPAGWRAHASGLRTDWITGSFPLDPSCITVWPAVPGSWPETPPPVPEGPGVMGPFPIHTRGGLQGFTWRVDGAFVDGQPRRRDFVLLADGRYRYAARLETEPAHHDVRRADFLEVLDSLMPAPTGRTTPERASVLDLWTE